MCLIIYFLSNRLIRIDTVHYAEWGPIFSTGLTIIWLHFQKTGVASIYVHTHTSVRTAEIWKIYIFYSPKAFLTLNGND